MSTQDQNTPQQKDERPIWARLSTKATAERCNLSITPGQTC